MTGRTRWFALAVLAAIACASTACRIDADEAVRPKNVVLLIGDGMGLSHVTAGRYAKGELSLESFRTAGFLLTHAGNALVTDSAAAGTALATGEKGENGAISVDMGGNPARTMLEWAEEAGMSTGIVTACSVTHATPACFMAHSLSRNSQSDIADQIARSGVDVLFGGGWSYFVPKSAEGSNRGDEKDLLEALSKKMTIARTPEEYAALGDDMPAAALLAPGHPGAAGERMPSLAELARKALNILSKNEKGFFLMVEGSQIDWASHAKDGPRVIREVTDFDDAVSVVLDFAGKTGDTIVVVTADHETGGFAVHQGSVEGKEISETSFSAGDHTASMVPLFATGPGAEVFGGIHDNTFVGKTLIGYIRAR